MRENELSKLEQKSAEEIIQWAINTYQNKVALASSFGAEDVVLVDMMVKVSQHLAFSSQQTPRIFTLDTGRLPQETYDVMEKIREKYNLNIEVYFPNAEEVEEMERKYGPNLFYKSVELRQLCCKVRKIEPLSRAFKDLSAWICGLRKEQSVTRVDVKKVEEEIRVTDNGQRTTIVKINPLADWRDRDVWDYIKKHNVPYNALHDKNYPSIGCAPCTRAIKEGEDIRAGRWWWETPDKKECGLHCKK